MFLKSTRQPLSKLRRNLAVSHANVFHMKKIEWSGFASEGLDKAQLEARIKELLALQNFVVENGELDEVSRDAIIEWSRSRIAAHRYVAERVERVLTPSAYSKSNG